MDIGVRKKKIVRSGTSLSLPALRRMVLAQSGILSARVQPHPQRLPPTSAMPVQPHFMAPLLEKSNVLVMHVFPVPITHSCH